MEEALGVLTVVRGSIEINIAMHKVAMLNELPLDEDEDYDE
jgi:hypothetical protein